MSFRSARVLGLAIGLGLAFTFPTTAFAADETTPPPASPTDQQQPTTAELLNQIKQLQAKVEQLETKQQQQQLQNNADVAATVDKLVKDAEKRSTVLPTGDGTILAGHNGTGFFIKSADGNYLLLPSAEMQIRDTTNYDSADSSTENGFEIRRQKFRLEGNVINPDLTFALQYSTGASNGTPNLEDAWAKYQWTPGWFIEGGQFKDPLLKEQLVSGRRQMAADRSLLSLLMTGSSDNYVQGVMVIYDGKDQPWRVSGAFTDGIGSQDTTWRDFPTNSTDWGAAGRAEYFVMGDRKQYDDFTALLMTKDVLVFGVAGDSTQAGSNTAYTHTVDAMWKNTHGLSAYGAFVGQYQDFSPTSAYNWGLEMQVGWVFKQNWEVFARYDFMKFENEVAFSTGGSEDLFNEITIGLNRYIQSYYAKFTLDFTYLPNGSPVDEIGLGEIAGDEAQYILRAQFQLVL